MVTGTACICGPACGMRHAGRPRTCDFKAAADNCEAVPVTAAAAALGQADRRGRGVLVVISVRRYLIYVINAKVLGEVTVEESVLLACAHHLRRV